MSQEGLGEGCQGSGLSLPSGTSRRFRGAQVLHGSGGEDPGGPRVEGGREGVEGPENSMAVIR